MRQVVGFVINGMLICFNSMKGFIFDRIGTLDISLYSFFIFIIFMTIVIRLINFIKGIQEVQAEQKEEANSKKPKGAKK